MTLAAFIELHAVGVICVMVAATCIAVIFSDRT